jgi:spore maturation protein CgeB
MMGSDRGNMRCFEAMGGGAMLLTDAGNYPAGMEDGKTMRVYRDAADAVEIIKDMLQSEQWRTIAKNGHNMIADKYSKAKQFSQFCNLV